MSEVSREAELWLPVVGFEGWYEVSDCGRVRSVERVIELTRMGKTTARRLRMRVLRPGIDQNGRPHVDLQRAGQSLSRNVHLLVLEAFVGPRPAGLHGCHHDDVPTNNRLDNLRWDTPSANRYDSSRNGTHHNTKVERCPLEHLLRAPNLTAYHALRGHRGCLACARARSAVYGYAKRGKTIDFAARAHWQYARIMGEAEPSA